MKLLRSHAPPGPAERRGAVLLLSFLVLIVVIAIVYQLSRVTGADQQIAYKDLTLQKMDLAIESAFLEVIEQLREDGALRSAGGQGAGMPSDLENADAGPGAEEGESEGNPDAVDSQMDDWAQVASTTINELNLRILIVDEDRKYNVLNMLAEDEEEAQEAYDRVVRILDLCREGTASDIGGADAEEMARAMRDHLLERDDSVLPRTALLSDDEEDTRRGMPLTMREFVVLEPFLEDHFRDYFDGDENRVHAIDQFLTVYTAPYTEGGEPGEEGASAGVTAEGGKSVNVNTAPLAVLTGLTDDRDVDGRFWDAVVEYRNLEEELPPDQEELDPILDEFGQEILRRQFFDDLEELSEVPGWDDLPAEVRAKVEPLLRVESDVFSVYMTARKVTGDEKNQILDFTSRLEQELYERSGAHLVRTVRAVFWRQIAESEVQMVPLVRWEVLDFAPLPVLDYPDEAVR